MSWEQWPFHTRSLTDMIGPVEDAEYNERFVSLVVSGCSERLGRPLTVLEPELDTMGEPIQEPDPDNPVETRLKLRRIDHINPREHFTEFCNYLRDLTGQEEACRECDEDIARWVMRLADAEPERLMELARGYPCRMNLIDQVSVIRHHQTPVGVVFSGQFLPDNEAGQVQVEARIEEIATEYGLTDDEQMDLHILVEKLETREEYIDRYMNKVDQIDRSEMVDLEEQEPTLDQLFLNEVREIEGIACAQFHMHKRNRESAFRHELREIFPSLPAESRDSIAQRTQPVLEKVLGFCGTDYLALFISPRRYISYESHPNLLHPFVSTGVVDEAWSGIQHLNWRKAGLKTEAGNNASEKHEPPVSSLAAALSMGIMIGQDKVQRALKSGLKGEDVSLFSNAAMLSQMYLSYAYRAVLIWGPFHHLTAADLEQEKGLLEEISEFVMMRVLSLVQLSDSERRTEAWEDVTGLLSHYSRRAMQPVSTGVRIIADHVQGGKTYSRNDALGACDSLETASRFISEAVRAPVFSFAAITEGTYKFVPASLDEIVRDCMTLHHPTALEKRVSVTIDPGLARLPDAEVDVAKMRDAIGYILDNAIKYSHENKEVRIYGELSGTSARLTIENFGLGIDEDELHMIFRRGYQGRRSRKAIYEEGEGLGLFQARRIIEAHKGKIWAGCRSGARSETSARLEGYRVWFTFELPIKQSDT
jgi:signal transduction histidine kinase/ligand-binding sensor protein